MAEIAKSVERTARIVLRRALRLLEGSRALAERLASRLSSRADGEARGAPRAMERERPLSRARSEPRGGGSRAAVEALGLDQPLSEGYMVVRVAGEQAAFEAPLPLVEERLDAPPSPSPEPPPLPMGYQDDAFVALARDPHTLWLYWDFSPHTVARAMEGLYAPRTKLRIFQGVHRVRDMDFALESGSYYVSDLSPGEQYEAEIVCVGDNGERRLGARSNAVRLPNFGPSPIIDDRFATLPWEARLPRGLDGLDASLPSEWSQRLEGWSGRLQGASEVWYERRRRPEVGSGGHVRRPQSEQEGR